MVQVAIFQNKQNSNKFIEVHVYSDGHKAWKQFMEWQTVHGTVRNYIGSRSKQGRLFRASGRTMCKVLDDYSLVTTM